MTRRDRLMKHPPLPTRVAQLLLDSDSPPRLIRHLEIVHGTCCRLLDAFRDQFPQLPLDADTICLGAAIHDVGKLIHPEELFSAGHRHEEDGPAFLIERGFPPEVARFARSHGRWDEDPQATLDDLIVALADEVWKGRRNDHLESRLVQFLADRINLEAWQIFQWLDGVIEEITTNVDGQL